VKTLRLWVALITVSALALLGASRDLRSAEITTPGTPGIVIIDGDIREGDAHQLALAMHRAAKLILCSSSARRAVTGSRPTRWAYGCATIVAGGGTSTSALLTYAPRHASPF